MSFRQLIGCGVCSIALTGCATFTTLDADVPLVERVFIYSGTRLDWAAWAENEVAMRKFRVAPPTYPLLDLPFSFALDSLFFPLAVGAEIFH